MCLRLKTKKEITIVDEFQKTSVWVGDSVKEAALEAIKNYTAMYAPDVTVITERELIAMARKLKSRLTHGTVKKWRRLGILQDDAGPWWRSNPEGLIVYHKERMEQFLKARKKAPYSRLVPREEVAVA